MKQYTAVSLFTAPADNRLVIDYGCGGVGRKNKRVGHCFYACKKGWGMQYFDNTRKIEWVMYYSVLICGWSHKTSFHKNKFFQFSSLDNSWPIPK